MLSFSQDLFGKLALPGIIIGLFTVTAFTPEVNSDITVNTGQDSFYSTFTAQTVQPVFKSAVEYINLTEPGTGNITKVTTSSANITPLIYTSSGYHANNQYPGNYIYFSDNIPHKSYRQICLFLDLPPPVLL